MARHRRQSVASSFDRMFRPVRVSQSIPKRSLDVGRLRSGLASLEALHRELEQDARRFRPQAVMRSVRRPSRLATGLALAGLMGSRPVQPAALSALDRVLNPSSAVKSIEEATIAHDRQMEEERYRARVCAERAQRKEVMIAKGLHSSGRRKPSGLPPIKC